MRFRSIQLVDQTEQTIRRIRACLEIETKKRVIVVIVVLFHSKSAD